MRLIIKNATIVNEGKSFKSEVLIEGKFIKTAVKETKITPIIIFSSDGKNPEATVIAIDHAFGLIN